jgi:hypothetical protein
MNCALQFEESQLKEIFNDNEGTILLEKREKFKLRKILDGDPLVKWCPKPGCELYVKAENTTVQKVKCECG